MIFKHYYDTDTVLTSQILRDQVEGMLDELDVTVIYVVSSYGGQLKKSIRCRSIFLRN